MLTWMDPSETLLTEREWPKSTSTSLCLTGCSMILKDPEGKKEFFKPPSPSLSRSVLSKLGQRSRGMREKHMRTPSHTSTHLGSILFRLRDQRPNEERKEARKLIKSYVTCSNTLQREIDRDYHYHDMETSPKKKNDEPSESEDNAGGSHLK
ncbi:hypothetical protein Tco_0926589 [Tanacetum coccineum]|uniref:Uncharacterized protein n=1 Tax=Tanacetum coccineum TaxID=301880 RepID=A0ABQ5DA82_9ASTR